jgi:hypothetical protein
VLDLIWINVDSVLSYIANSCREGLLECLNEIVPANNEVVHCTKNLETRDILGQRVLKQIERQSIWQQRHRVTMPVKAQN